MLDQIIASGTIIETATGTREFLISFQMPALYIFIIIGITALSLGVFYLFFKSIWSD